MNDFEKKISYFFHNANLLKQAFIHSSFAHENRINSLDNNERLEFLGDAVLELTISDFIFKTYRGLTEGDLTKLRASVVCEPTLAKMARGIAIGDYLKLGKGEAATGGRDRDSILADAFEAVIGAIYLDGGLDSAKGFILYMMQKEVEMRFKTFKTSDYKTHLQEIIQKVSKAPLSYAIVSEMGPDHNKDFVANVTHENKLLGKGIGKSKKEAEQNAALNAINLLKQEDTTSYTTLNKLSRFE